MDDGAVSLRPVRDDDLATFRRFAIEPRSDRYGLDRICDANEPARRFAADGYLGDTDGQLMAVYHDMPSDS